MSDHDKNCSDVSYTELEKNTIERNRKFTNVPSLFVFILYMTLWYIVGMYVIFYAASTSDSLNNGGTLFNNKTFTYKFFGLNSAAYLIFGILAVIITLFYLLILRVFAKFFVIIAIILLILQFCLIPLISVVVIMIIGQSMLIFLAIVMCVIFLIYDVIILRCINKVKLNLISKIIKVSCRVISSHISMQIVIYLTIIIEILISLFAVMVFYCLQVFTSTTALMILHAFNILGGFLAFNYVLYFGQMIMSDFVATLYWDEDNKKVPVSAIRQSFFRNLRYHSGTMAYAATNILPFFHAIIIACKWQRKPAEKYDNKVVRFLCKFQLLFEISSLAVIQTSIHGYNFGKASKRTFDLILINSARFIAISNVSYAVIGLGCAIIAFLNSSIADLCLPPSYNSISINNPVNKILFLYISYSTLIPLYVMINTTIRTVVMCVFEDLDINDGSVQKPYCKNNAFKKIFIDL